MAVGVRPGDGLVDAAVAALPDAPPLVDQEVVAHVSVAAALDVEGVDAADDRRHVLGLVAVRVDRVVHEPGLDLAVLHGAPAQALVGTPLRAGVDPRLGRGLGAARRGAPGGRVGGGDPGVDQVDAQVVDLGAFLGVDPHLHAVGLRHHQGLGAVALLSLLGRPRVGSVTVRGRQGVPVRPSVVGAVADPCLQLVHLHVRVVPGDGDEAVRVGVRRFDGGGDLEVVRVPVVLALGVRGVLGVVVVHLVGHVGGGSRRRLHPIEVDGGELRLDRRRRRRRVDGRQSKERRSERWCDDERGRAS